MICGMSKKTARRYVEVIESIERIVDQIHAMADMMVLLAELPDKEVRINPRSVSCFGGMIAYDILRIMEILDNDFASIAEVKIALKEG